VNQEKFLIERALDGDIKCFENIVNLYQHRLYCFIFKMTLSKEDTDDLVQETFIKVFINLYKYNFKWKFSSWIYKIAVNTIKNYWKKRKRISSNEVYNSIPSELYCDFKNNPENKYQTKENYIEILKIINQLHYKYKVVVVLRYLNDLSIKDIATIIGVSPETVRTRIHRARERICIEFKKDLKEDII